MAIIYVGNDNLIELDVLTNAISSAYINNATVTMQLVDSSNNVVAGTCSLTMAYIASSNGKYRATLPDTLTLTVGQEYKAKVTANGGDGLLGYWELRLFGRSRVV